jgi:16S rRNA C1402 (ribose-2'-O) methylase RsmI
MCDLTTPGREAQPAVEDLKEEKVEDPAIQKRQWTEEQKKQRAARVREALKEGKLGLVSDSGVGCVLLKTSFPHD